MWFCICFLQAAFAAEPYEIGLGPQKFFSTGLAGGVSLGEADGRGFVGLETQYTLASSGRWYGATADLVHDFGQESTVLTVGPKIGKLVAGLDGGLGVRYRQMTALEYGVQARSMINLGLFSIHYRFGYWPTADVYTRTHQLGMTFKVPTALSYTPRAFDASF